MWGGKLSKKLPTEINKFLGLNQDENGETQLLLGESPFMVNFQITETYKLKKRIGYEQLFASIAAKNIQGMWYGSLSGTYHFLFACNGKIYKHNLTTKVNTEIGTLTDAKTSFFVFQNKLYILNGYEYKYWDGTTFGVVAGYRPKIAIGTPPSGGGTLYEQINLLTGQKRQTFSADNTSKDYQLAETAITSVDFVNVNGVTKTLTTDYTVNLTTGKVTFVVAPTTGQDNVEIGWTKGTGDRTAIEKCRASLLYGGANDTRVFTWGNTSYKNRRYYTGLADGVPSAEYFPANNYSDVGSSEFAITDIVKQHDRQIIFTETNAFYSYLESIDNITAFPVLPLNDVKGNKPFNQARIILNNPYTVFEGVYEWSATNVRDERNTRYISKRVQPTLDQVDLNTAITFDYEAVGEYWLCVDNKVWIHNYRNDTWYYYELYNNIKSIITIDDTFYFGTDNGQIMKFDSEFTNDNGNVISAEWQMGFYDWGEEWLRKYLNKTWVSLKPESRSSIDVAWETNVDGSLVNPVPIQYSLFDFEKLDFEDWSFETGYNPQPFRLKTKAKKFVYFKLILQNKSLTYTATVLSINMLGRLGGQSK